MKSRLFSKNEFNIALILVVIVQAVLMFQGFDICDDGFVLTFYQQIFSHPESVEYNFLYWFSGIIGGLWYQLNEDGGILWFRILGVIVNTGTFVLSYNILKKYISPLYLVLSLSMVLFVNDFGFLTFYHNHLTSFLTVFIVYLLINALSKRNYLLFFLAGFVYVLNGLTRLPNFVLGCLFIAIPVYYYLKDHSIKNSIKPVIFVFSGILGAFLSVYVFLLISNQLQVVENAICTMFNLGNAEDSAHSYKTLLLALYFNYIHILKVFFEVLIIFSVSAVGLRFAKNNSILTYTIAIVLMFFFLFWFQQHEIFTIYTLAYTATIWLFFSKASSIQLRTIALMSFLMLLTLPIGTGGGVQNAGYMAIWLGFPLFFIALPSMVSKLFSLKIFKNFHRTKNIQFSPKIILYGMAISFLVLKSYNIFNEAYFDEGSRLEKTYAINSEKSKYIYTTKQRAEITNDLLLHLKDFVKPEDYLMAYDHIPMIHFLTETKPYTYNSWPGIYDSNSFEKKIKKAELEISELPIVVIQKFETLLNFSEPKEDYMIPEKNKSILHGSQSIKTMNAFLERNNYKVVWSNPYFSIYKSLDSLKAVN